MPTPENPINHRHSPLSSESPYSVRNTAAAETGSGRQSRKKGKHAVQKETNPAKDSDPSAAGERGGSPAPSRGENATTRPSKVSPASNDFAPTPVLDALRPAEKVSDLDNSTFTAIWAQSIPFSKSGSTNLPQGTSLGSSPPMNAPKMERGGFSSRSPPSSPPTRKSQPVSGNVGISPPRRRQSVSDKLLRTPPQHFGASSPPRPHLPQAHFYGVPDIDLGLGGRLRESAQDEAVRFLSFTELPAASLKRQKGGHDTFLMAVEDRLDVITLQEDKVSALGALEGVGGTIIDAKVLTWQSGVDPFHKLRPLISLVVHGPTRSRHASQGTSDLALDHVQIDTGTNATGLSAGLANEPADFQTTVEIYSLATQEHVSTLLWGQPTPVLPNFRGLSMNVPPPVGNLKLDARGNFLTVSSGTSGEIFVFTADKDNFNGFKCLGKIWTTVQTLYDRRYSESSNSTDTDTSPADVNRGAKLRQLPIMSLSSRWLAVVPPEPVSGQSLPVAVASGTIPTTVPGLESRNAPPQPPVSCAIESPDAESFINRVARGVAQEVVRGARWLGGQGYQSWNNYWNRDQNVNAQVLAPNRNVYPPDSYVPAGVFPPTHAPEARTTSAEPQLVSIIDLQVLSNGSHASASDRVIPLTTFQPPSGVSFLSFAPDGLAILSATRKGDVQYVWNLKQMRHLRAGVLLTNSDSEASTKAGKVTQVARFARLTPSSIVDIEWRCPSGDQFAVVTKNGTIHVFDLPLSALQWPPTRRASHTEPYSAPASPAVTAQADEPTVIGGVLSSAIKLAGKTQPMLATLRGRAPSIAMSNAGGSGVNSLAFASATGVRGSKAVAAGLSRSVGAATGAVSSLRHAGDHRLHLVSLAKNPARSRVRWSQNPHQSTLVVLDGQSIKRYRVSRKRSSSKPKRQVVSVIDANPRLSCPLPAFQQLTNTTEATSKALAQHDTSIGEKPPRGYWTLAQSSRAGQAPGVVHPPSCAEIETNAPYQPFHSDRRVGLMVYPDRTPGADAEDAQEPWVFGNDISATRLDVRPPRVSDDDDANEPSQVPGRSQGRDGAGSILYRHTSITSGDTVGKGDAAIGDQIVVTTRRRKNKGPYQSQSGIGPGSKSTHDGNGHGDGDGDGFFEDDCDVLDFADDRV